MELLDRKIFYPLFLAYCCFYGNNEREVKLGTKYFYYWDCNNDEKVWEMLGLSSYGLGKDWNDAIRFFRKITTATVSLEIKDRNLFFKKIDKYLKDIIEAKVLKPSLTEDREFCITLYPFNKQLDRYISWLSNHQLQYGDGDLFIRKDHILDEDKQNYHQFCFEEMIIYLNERNYINNLQLEVPKRDGRGRYMPCVDFHYNIFSFNGISFNPNTRLLILPRRYKEPPIKIDKNSQTKKWAIIAVMVMRGRNRYLTADLIAQYSNELFNLPLKSVRQTINDIKSKYNGLIISKDDNSIGRGNVGKYKIGE